MHYKNNIVFRFMYYECIKRNPVSILVILFTGIYWAIDINIRPYLFKLMFDQLSKINQSSVFSGLVPYIVILFGSIIARSAVFRLYDFAWMYVKPEMKLNVTRKLMDNILHRSHVFLQRNVSGSLSNQIQDVINTLPLFVNLIVNNFSAHIIAFFISFSLFWYINIKFAIILLIWAIVFISGAILFTLKGQSLSSRVAKKQFIAFGEVVDILQNVFRVKLFNRYSFEAKRIDSYFKTFGNASKKRDYWIIIVSTIQTISYAIYQLACLLILAYEYKRGRVTIGDFVLILTINRDMIDYMWVLSEDISRIGEYYGSTKQVLNGVLTSYNALHSFKEEVANIKIRQYNIEFDNVSFKYPGQDKYVFENLSLKIESKQKVGIVGYSGAGKSSLINVLLRLCDINSGVIKIDEQNIKNFHENLLRNLFSVISQEPVLLNRTIRENIAYGAIDTSKDVSMDEIIAAAKKAQAHDFIMATNKGYETVVGQKGSNLSIGQRQRIVIACAILRDAPILIMDEATSALDVVTENKLNLSMKSLMKNKTVLIIAHKLETLEKLDRIIVLNDGQIIQDGPHDILAKQKGLYQDLIKAQRENTHSA